MDETIKQALVDRVAREPFARKLGLRLVDLRAGYSRVEMDFTSDLENIFGMAHGGAVFALMDEAFETAVNSHGTVAVALSMTVNYTAAAEPGSRLTAEAREMNRSRRTALYDIRVTDENGRLIATCQALAYRKGATLPFIHGD
jgi:acyl-CoA thioesterase